MIEAHEAFAHSFKVSDGVLGVNPLGAAHVLGISADVGYQLTAVLRGAEWRAFSDYRFENGLIVEATQIHDTYQQYLQLGLIDPPS